MTAEIRTIEQMITEWYATGTCSDECRLEIERVAKFVARRYARTRKGHLAQQIIDGAPGHVWEMLAIRISPDHATGRYEPNRPFSAWCSTVLFRYAVDCDRKDGNPVPEDRGPAVGGDAVDWIPDNRKADESYASDNAAIAASILAEYEQLLPRPVDRIIVAVQTGFIDGLSDAVVTRWCEEADVPVETTALRRLVDEVGCLKALATVLNLSYDVTRARSCRAMRDLRAGDFCRAREEFER
jgi:hypothetical protein